MERHDGGPAFPRPGNYPAGMGEMAIEDMRDAIETINKSQRGMSYRQYLVAKLAAALLQVDYDHTFRLPDADWVAKGAARYADAILDQMGLRYPVEVKGEAHE